MNAFLRVKVSDLHEKCNFNYRSPKSYMIRWMDVKNQHNDFYQRVGFSWEQIEFLSFTFDFPESEKLLLICHRIFCQIWKYKISIRYCPWLIYPESNAIEKFSTVTTNMWFFIRPLHKLWHLWDTKMSPKSPVKDVQETLFQGGTGEGEGGVAPKKEMIVSVSGAGDTKTSVMPKEIATGNGNGSNTNMCRVNSEAGSRGRLCLRSMCCMSVLVFLVKYGMWFLRNVLYMFSLKLLERNVLEVSRFY